MLMVPPALFFIQQKNNWIKWSLLTLFFICGVYTSVKASFFSYGPYRQSMEYLSKAHPEVQKILHVTEITSGSLMEHNTIGNWQHYFLKNEKTLYYTNMKVFKELHQTGSLDEFLIPDEEFCVFNLQDFYLNKENFDQVLSECQTVAVDTITDNKSKDRFQLLLYVLKFRGNE